MKAAQLVPYVLPTVNWVSGGNNTVSLRDVPHRIDGRLCHVAGISIEADIDPTFSTAPTLQGLHTVINRLEISDGQGNRFTGDLWLLRTKEILENGGVIVPDPDLTSASTNNFYVERYWDIGPGRFAGSPRDFVFPCSAMENAEIRLGFGALTDISADASAATCVFTITVWLMLLDAINLPPAYEWFRYTAAGPDIQLSGRAMYAFLALLDSSAYGLISAGDFGNITVETGRGQVVSSIPAEILGRAYRAHMKTGQFTAVQGEPRSATDDNPKAVLGGAPTAVGSSQAYFQPVLWSPPEQQISKLVALAESALRVLWNGSQTGSGTIITGGRILELSDAARSAVAAKALGKLNLKNGGAKVKTLSKAPYTGPRPEFMPLELKVA